MCKPLLEKAIRERHPQAISHSGFMTAYWIFEPHKEKHISSHGSNIKYAVKKVEQGRDRIAERQNNLPLPNSSIVYTTATMPHVHNFYCQ